MRAKFMDYCRPLKLWRERALVLFFLLSLTRSSFERRDFIGL